MLVRLYSNKWCLNEKRKRKNHLILLILQLILKIEINGYRLSIRNLKNA